MSVQTESNKAENDGKYLALAFAQRLRSDDPKAQHTPESGVGAIIVLNGQVISQSANVLPPLLKAYQVKHGNSIQEADRNHLIEHAERAAIYTAMCENRSTIGSTMYCTRYPCSDCARAIVWAGIKRIVLATGFEGENRWLDSQKAASEIFAQADIEVRVLMEPSPYKPISDAKKSNFT